MEVSTEAREASVAEPWLAEISRGRSEADREVIARAIRLAQAAHRGQTRASGEPYIGHPLAVASILHELNMDTETVIAAILHDVVEDTSVDLAHVQAEFGPAVARLVDGVTKMHVIREYQGLSGADQDAKQVDRLRKLLLAMAEDVRVVLVKLADRLHNMRTLRHLDEARRRRIARETLDIYAPLASRLGIWQMKWEMEDQAFRYLQPDSYKTLARQLHERRTDRERYISLVVEKLSSALKAAGIAATVTGRPKHIYSIWRKMQSKGVDLPQLFDVRGLRVLVESVADCYAALGIVHTLWQHIPGEFDDYIANPKPNLYQSLHTAVIGPRGRTLEVQIRTHEMHQHAELGVAAHWRYKDGSRRDPGIEERVAWLRQVLEWKDDPNELGGLLERFQSEVLHDRVYVVTPRGQVVDLPRAATPLDFAYHIHTEVGHRCRGAKVDGAIVSLNQELETGQQVEILTTRHGAPSRDWLNPHLGYLRTARARAKVRHWFRQQDYDKNLAAGRDVYERELKRLGIGQPDTDKLVKRFNYVRFDDLLAAIGHGEVTTGQIANALQDIVPRAQVQEEPPVARGPAPREKNKDSVRIEGVGNLLTQTARCCKPLPPDPIIGYITRGRGVTVHRRDCRNVLRLGSGEQARLIDVSWAGRSESTYPVDVLITAYDRQALLRDITTVVANERLNVVSLNTQTEALTQTAQIRVTFQVTDLAQLSRVLDRISQLPNVVDVQRQTS
ncbi:MAG: GTP diphosphokinase [Gammaproteobacteria bacterium]|nr:GTP diphosphokinase [Gammaproteobacteria bacterium]NIR84433.1 GTP diphosphokinase [Gammaproteobacteria bacterium]NIR90914.1 GTP diphosphokinase [Gammaproteobacteria bacterium]NIU07100.1 GTP diphosphokinase [Gammaproteobacteria bacterium]NIV76229.1 GTP diphosphokinase [Gammaproteobacteria bacterium]